MPRQSAAGGARAGVRSIRRFPRALAVTLGVSLLFLVACGGEGVRESADDAGASTAASAETRDVGRTHAHEGGDEHSHQGAGSHAHPAADTLAAEVALGAGPGESWSGSVTVLTVGDSVRILVTVDGAPAGSRHPVELVTGSCEDAGSELASLTPVAAGTSGAGSSQTTLPTVRLGGHAHGAVRVLSGDDTPAACASIHLPATEHEHPPGEE